MAWGYKKIRAICVGKKREHLQFVDFCMYRNFEAVRYDANRIPSNACKRKSCNMTMCGDSKSIAGAYDVSGFIQFNFCGGKKIKLYMNLIFPIDKYLTQKRFSCG